MDPAHQALLALRQVAWRLQPTRWLPLRATRTATSSTWRYGSSVPAVPRDQQWREQRRLRMQFRSSFDSYYRYRLYDPARLSEAPAFLELEEMIVLRRWLYPQLPVDREDLADKRRFNRRAVAAGLPTPGLLATVANRQIVDAPARLPDDDLFTKEAHGLCGQGATYWIRQDNGMLVASSGQRVPRDRFLEALARASAGKAFVVQRRLTNHPAVRAFSAAGLCTVRVITSRAPNERPIVLRACFRMPVGEGAADNFAQGGIASPIDLTTGALGPAVQKSLRAAGRSLDTHPTTGAPLTGSRLPVWPEVLALALRAHETFGEFPSVGWDIAITPGGPMVIEGNYNWDVVLAQQPYGRSLADTPFADHFWAHAPAASRGQRPPVAGRVA